MGDPDEFDDRDVPVFGVWGWYDYSVKIPMDELGYQEKVAFSNVKSGLEAHANGEDNALQTAVQAIQAPPTTDRKHVRSRD